MTGYVCRLSRSGFNVRISAMNVGVIVFPGSNCDRDVRVALSRGRRGTEPAMIWHRESTLPMLDLIVLPGGYSYGDYLRSGAMAAHSPVMQAVVEAARAGTPVLAICNGFQIAAEAGLVPGGLIANENRKFICRDVDLRVENTDSRFTSGYQNGQIVRYPIAHHDGNYYADEETLKRLEGDGQIAFRYCSADGAVTNADNPNGSLRNIAGVFNQARNVLALMPHPERAADTRLGGCDGHALFDAVLASLS